MESLRLLLTFVFGFSGILLVQRANQSGSAWVLFVVMFISYVAFGLISKFGKD